MGGSTSTLDEYYWRVAWRGQIIFALHGFADYYPDIFDPRGEDLRAVNKFKQLPSETIRAKINDVVEIMSRFTPRIDVGDVDESDDVDILIGQLCEYNIDYGLIVLVGCAHRRQFYYRYRCRLAAEKITPALSREEIAEYLKSHWLEGYPSMSDAFREAIREKLHKIGPANVGQNKLADVFVLYTYYKRNYRTLIDLKQFIFYLRGCGYKIVESNGKLVVDKHRIKW
jgi:hypothetical protein